jgi:uncharacterized protein YbbK (DUF523 family)
MDVNRIACARFAKGKRQAIMKLISACLVGLCTNYLGEGHPVDLFVAMLRRGELVPACPEQLGGLPTPRPPAEIQPGCDGFAVLEGKGRVLRQNGEDVTAAFIRGAQEMLKLAQACRAELVILKERSPSCGVRIIHDGAFCGRSIAGIGVTTALLKRHGIEVVSDEQYLERAR